MKIIKKYLVLLLIVTLLIIAGIYYSAEAKDEIESFPQSYRPYLEELKKKYPNWSFTPLYTNLNWNDVINQENKFGKN